MATHTRMVEVTGTVEVHYTSKVAIEIDFPSFADWLQHHAANYTNSHDPDDALCDYNDDLMMEFENEHIEVSIAESEIFVSGEGIAASDAVEILFIDEGNQSIDWDF